MNKIPSSQITSYFNYINRRKFIKTATATSFLSVLPFSAKGLHNKTGKFNNQLDEGDNLNTFEEITTYN